MTGRVFPALVAACAFFSLCGEASAQLTNPWATYSSDRFVNSNMQLFFQNRWNIARMRAQGKNQLADAMEGRSTGTYQNAQPRQANPASTLTGTQGAELLNAPLSMTTFNSVGAPSVYKRVAASISGITPEHRKQLESAFLELTRSYDRLLAENSQLQLKNNLAGAFNFLFTVSYYVLKDRELSEAQQKNMLDQVNVAIALGLKDQPMSDREKQDVYESAVLSGMLVLGLYNEGREQGNAETLKTARTLAKDFLNDMMGISIDRVRVSGNAVQIN